MDQKSQKSMRTRSNRNDKRTSNSREPDRNRSSASKGNSSRRRRRKRNLLIRFFLLFILIVGVIGTCFYIKKYGPSKEKEDLNNYYGIEKENQLAITIDNKV
ncbi:MAG: glycosyl hydrolase family 18, partial [Lachnospiraceae bacterium]